MMMPFHSDYETRIEFLVGESEDGGIVLSEKSARWFWDFIRNMSPGRKANLFCWMMAPWRLCGKTNLATVCALISCQVRVSGILCGTSPTEGRGSMIELPSPKCYS